MGNCKAAVLLLWSTMVQAVKSFLLLTLKRLQSTTFFGLKMTTMDASFRRPTFVSVVVPAVRFNWMRHEATTGACGQVDASGSSVMCPVVFRQDEYEWEATCRGTTSAQLALTSTQMEGGDVGCQSDDSYTDLSLSVDQRCVVEVNRLLTVDVLSPRCSPVQASGDGTGICRLRVAGTSSDDPNILIAEIIPENVDQNCIYDAAEASANVEAATTSGMQHSSVLGWANFLCLSYGLILAVDII